MSIVGCPKCRHGVSLGDRAIGVICSKCNTYFNRESSVEPEYVPAASIAVHGEAALDRAAFRGAYENMADDSKTGKAREQGASHYRNQYRYRDTFRKPPPS